MSTPWSLRPKAPHLGPDLRNDALNFLDRLAGKTLEEMGDYFEGLAARYPGTDGDASDLATMPHRKWGERPMAAVELADMPPLTMPPPDEDDPPPLVEDA